MITKIRTNGSSDTSMSVAAAETEAPCANAGEMNMKVLWCAMRGGCPGGACRRSGARNVRGL